MNGIRPALSSEYLQLLADSNRLPHRGSKKCGNSESLKRLQLCLISQAKTNSAVPEDLRGVRSKGPQGNDQCCLRTKSFSNAEVPFGPKGSKEEDERFVWARCAFTEAIPELGRGITSQNKTVSLVENSAIS